jgi:transcriptional regulator NrdR family protein
MIENEPKWLNYEFEQAQVKIDVGDMILEQLVNETISVLNEQATREISADDLLKMML